MIRAAALLLAGLLQAATQTPGADDPALRLAVERFYQTQEQEDAAGYLALWSTKVQRPTAEQLKYVFDSGDDKFAEIEITRVVETRGRLRVRVAATRTRTSRPRPDGTPGPTFTSRLVSALTFERDGADWKLVREGAAADDLAAELLDAATEEEREALLASEPDLVGPQLLSALARFAGAAATSQQYPRAQQIYERLAAIARRGGFKKEEGEALQNIGNALYFQRRFPEALTAYEQRLAIERERADEAGIASALTGIATIRYSYAEYTEALARYSEALAIQERIDDVTGLAVTSLSIGNIAYLQGDFQSAILAYRRSLELNRTMFYADGESRALEGLGRVYMAQGDYAGALEAFETVLRDPRLQSARGRLGSAAQNLGEVHFRLGNLDVARARYDESRAHYEAMKDQSNVGRVVQATALTELVAGRLAQAEDGYRRSGSICKAAGDDGCTAGATAGLAYALSAQERYWDSAASYRQAIREFGALGQRESVARSEVGLSQALVGAGDFAAAIEAATRARHIAIALGSDDMLWRALTAEARAVRKIGDVPRALGVARASVTVLDRLQAEALDKPGSSLTAEAAGALATFAVLQAESGQAAGAFATSERLRTIEIRAGLATNERDIARGMTEEERAEERTLAATVLTRLAQVTRERTLPKPDAARVATLDAAVAEAKTARREWMRRLFERHPALQTWRGLGAPRLVVDAAPLLTGPAELVVAFVLDDDDLLAMTIARQETEAGVTPALEIEAHVTHVNRRHVNASVLAIQQAAALNDANAWKTAMSEVVALLTPALQSRLAAASKVTILPHDVLWRVPFEALPLQDRLLGDRTSVSIAGSLDSTIRAAAIASRQTGPRLLAVGAPELVPGRLARYKQVAPGWNLRGAESADPELSAVSSAYDAALVTTLSRAMATETAVREQLAAQAIHVAAPFRINAASPLFSSMLLSTLPPTEGAAAEPAPSAAPGPGATPAAQPVAGSGSLPPRPELASNDGALELREVMNLDAGARIVVFSDGAATSMRDGASAADVLQWGWLAAGVPSLLVARWSAPPTTGPTLLAEFHKQIASGARPADALRAAQALIRSSADTAAPIYWAGWMLLGPQ